MLPDATFDPAPPRRNLRLRFSLFALFVFVTLVCIILAWLAQPNRVVATALFWVGTVSSHPIFGDPVISEYEPDLKTFKRTQAALIKSHFVLTSALRSASITQLPLLQSRKDPVEWLQQRLEVEFPEDAEIMAIRLRGPEQHANDLVRLVDAVAKAYRDEVIYEERQRRLMERDLLARSLDRLKKQIERQWEEYLAIARESGRMENGSGQIEQELDLKRLDRIDAELLRLETEQLKTQSAADAGDRDWIEKRLAQLRERQAELQKRIFAHGEKPLELSMRERELERLKRISDEMSLKLQMLDIEAAAPDRIRQIQSAVAGPDD